MANVVDERFSFDIDTAAAVANLRLLLTEVERYQRELTAAKKDSDEFKKASEQLAKAEQAVAGVLLQETKTLEGLEQKMDLLRRTQKQLEIDSEGFAAITKELTAAQKAYDKALGLTNDTVEKTKKKVSETSTVMQGLKSALATISVAALAQQVIEAQRSFEKLGATMRQQFKGDALGAQKAFNDIKILATELPFSVEEITQAFLKLKARGIDPTIDDIRTLSDIAAFSGKGLDQLSEALLDAQIGQFERLQEFGIKVQKTTNGLSAAFGTQTPVVLKNNQALVQYIFGLGKLPQVQGTSAAVAKTLDGALSNLGDNLQRIFAAVGSGSGVFTTLVNALNNVLGAVVDFVETPLSETLREQQVEFNSLVGVLQDVNASEETRSKAIAALNLNYGEYIGNVNLNKATEEELNGVLQKGNDLFARRIFLQQSDEKRAEITKRLLDAEERVFQARLRAQETQQAGLSGKVFGTGIGGAVQSTDKPLGVRRQEAIQDAENEVRAIQNEIAAFNERQNKLAEQIFGAASSAPKKTLEELKFLLAQYKSELKLIASKTSPEAIALQKKIDETQAQINKLAPKKPGGGSADAGDSKTKKDADAVKGSLEALREELDKVEKQITEGTSLQDRSKLKTLIDQSEQLKVKITEAEALIESLRKKPLGEVIPSDEELTRQLGAGASESLNFRLREAQRQQIRDELAVEFQAAADEGEPITVDIKPEVDPDAKKKLKETFESIGQLAVSVIDAGQQIFDAQLSRIDTALSKQEGVLQNMLDNSEDFSAKQIEIEKKRLEDLRKEQEQAANRAKAAQIAQVTANTIIAVAKAAGQTGVAAPVAVATTLAAILGGIASAYAIAQGAFFEGTEELKLGPGMKKGRDTIPAMVRGKGLIMLNEGEGIIPTDINKKNRVVTQALLKDDIPPNAWAQMIAGYRSGATSMPTMVHVNNSQNIRMDKLESKVDQSNYYLARIAAAQGKEKPVRGTDNTHNSVFRNRHK